MTFFSIIIPLYNKENHIEQTLKSVMSQTFNDFEIVIINDGSTDNSVLKVKQFEDDRIKLFSKENGGASSARNLGLEKASGSLIAFLDADDIWEDNHLSELHRLTVDFPECGLYASRYNTVFDNNIVYTPSFKNIDQGYRGIVSDYFESSMYFPIATSSSIAVRKEVFKQVGNFKLYISSGQDTDMWIRVALNFKAAISNKVTATYLQFIKNSLSKTNILNKKLMLFNEYDEAEILNPSLKKYLDRYRKEYAIHYKMAGDSKTSKELFNKVDKHNISFTYKILYSMPRPILISLLTLKRVLKRTGLEFTIYN